jgi:hypothetical protein
MDKLHELVKQYTDEGLSFIPIPFKSKTPTIEWKKYQTQKPTQQETTAWFNGHDTNLAIICGEVSDNLVVLDFDSKEIYERFNGLFKEKFKIDILEFTRVSKTSRGYHVWLKVGETVSNQKYPSMDIKSTGGYIIAPPSVHPGGATYKLLNNLGITWVETLADVGIQTIKPNKTPTIDNPGWVAKAFEGVNGGSRNETAFKLAGYFKNRNAIDITTSILTAWNTKNKPPLPESELASAIKSAYNYTPKFIANNANNANSLTMLTEGKLLTDANNANWQEFTIEQAQEFDDQRVKTGNYAKVAFTVKEFIDEHPDERFDLDTICRNLDISGGQNRRYVSIELARQVEKGKLEKLASGAHSYYKYVNTFKRIVPWYNADVNNTIPIRWPRSHRDDTGFGFSNSILVSQGNLIVIAGVSNMGKTGFAQNFLFENMDLMPCQMMVNEYNPGSFKRRIDKMGWANPFNDKGEPKFVLVERHEDWKYAIEPDAINIIDWINIADGDFYRIGTIMEGIQGKLNKGIAMLVLQKTENKDLGTGGQFSEHLAAVYLSIDKNRLTVRKAKEYNGSNPNNSMWGFEIEEGVDFNNIREVKPCTECNGNCVKNHTECFTCNSTGYVNK